MPRVAHPPLSDRAVAALAVYTAALRAEEDLAPATVRNYHSDLLHFVAWCEEIWAHNQEEAPPFTPDRITTPLLIRYRTHLQQVLRLKPATINRILISLKRYTAWAVAHTLLVSDPAQAVKLVREETYAPQQLTDDDEAALIAAVTANGSLRDRTIIIILLHTGLRAHELCLLRRADLHIGKRSGRLIVWGKGNKYREVPLNITARAALATYLPTLPAASAVLFPSEKTKQALSVRALGHIVEKYASLAQLTSVSPHDLRHRFGYRMAEVVPLHRLAQIMGHDSLDTTMRYVSATARDLQQEVEKIAWR